MFQSRSVTAGLPASGTSSQFERDLAALCPLASRVDRDKLMFAAGRAAERSRKRRASCRRRLGRWMWPTATAALAVFSAVLTVLFVDRPERVVRDTIYVRVPADVDQETAPDDRPRSAMLRVGADVLTPLSGDSVAGYLRTRQDITRRGIDALPAMRTGGGGASPSYGEWRKDLARAADGDGLSFEF